MSVFSRLFLFAKKPYKNFTPRAGRPCGGVKALSETVFIFVLLLWVFGVALGSL
jgi:hypothetical protein